MEQLHIVLEQNTDNGSGWRVRRIDGTEQYEWWNDRAYPTIEAFMEEEVKGKGWKNAGVDCGENDASIMFWR